MRTVIYFISFIVIFISLPVEGKILGNEDQSIKTIVEPIFQNFIQSFEVDSYEQFMQHLSIDVIEDVDRNKFLKQSQDIKLKMGSYVSHQYLGYVNQENMTYALFKVKYSDTTDDLFFVIKLNSIGDQVIITMYQYRWRI
jgi:NhaP-type Na+/H+ and K+/H+ antiporter